jgi:hypothetical protein
VRFHWNKYSQDHLKNEMERNNLNPIFNNQEWADFWSYLSAIAALRGKKMVVATPGRAPASVPATPAATTAGESSRKGGRNIRLSIASSLGTIDEDDQSEANTTFQHDITEDEPHHGGGEEEEEEEEQPLNDSRRSVRIAAFAVAVAVAVVRVGKINSFYCIVDCFWDEDQESSIWFKRNEEKESR